MVKLESKLILIPISWTRPREKITKQIMDIKTYIKRIDCKDPIFDSRYIPFTGTIKEYLFNMEKDQAEKCLNSLQDKLIANPEYHLAYSHGNLIKHMDCLEDIAFIPAFFKGLKHGCEQENSHLIRAACNALTHMKDASLDYLSVRMDKLQGNCLIELLDIIKAVDSEKAENLLIENFDLFIEEDRISTLDACESLLSLKALDLLDNKVGKTRQRLTGFLSLQTC